MPDQKIRRSRIGKKTCAALFTAAGLLFLSGCGQQKTYELNHAYDVYGTSIHYEQPDVPNQQQNKSAGSRIKYFAQDLCVGRDIETGTENLDLTAAEAAGVFHLSDKTISCSKNIYKKLYPASTTKMLTAYVALKYGKLTDQVTVSAKAASQSADSSISGLHAGDQLTLEDLLYGLLLKSGNDAADAIAEHISGDTKSFVALMNREAKALGATRSHFRNPHGLQDEKHYTCVYDLYLILHAALGYEPFEKIIHTQKYNPVYKDANGIEITQEWETSNQFLNGLSQPPPGINIIGGKTGTTNAAGYCLALYSENTRGEPIISIVMKAETGEDLYSLMADLLMN